MLKRAVIRTEPAIMLDNRGYIKKISSYFANKLGYDPENLVGESIFSIVAEGFKPFAKKAVRNGGNITVISRDGNFHRLRAVVEGQNVAIYDPDQLLPILRKSYAGVWDFHYGFVFVDEDRRIITANRTFYSVTGLDRSIEGKKLDDVFGELDRIFDRAVVDGEIDFTASIKGEPLRVRAKVREVEVCGKIIYEVFLRTTDEERLRNLKKTFDSINYPVLAFASGRLYYSNEVARYTFPNVESMYRTVAGKSAGKATIETVDGEKEYLFLKIPGIEEIYIFIDLSEQNDLIQKLKEELENYKTTFESSVDAILVTDLSGRILLANSAVSFHGYSPEELVGKNVFDFILPEYEDIVRESIVEGREIGGYKRIEIQIPDKSGRLRWVEVVGSAIKNEKGEVTGGVIVLRDITSKKELEKKVRESEELYKTLAENSQAGIFVIQDGRVVYMNRAAEDYAGYTKEELEDNYHILFEEDVRGEVKKILDRVLGGKSEVIFTRYITKNGERRYGNLLLFPIIYKGKPAVLGNFVDVTDMVEAERKLKEREELYRTLAENSHTGIFIIQNDRIVYANEKLVEMFGYTLEEIEKFEHPYVVVHPKHRELVISRYRARERGEYVPESYEVRVITKSGEEKWVRVLASRIKYRGKPAVIVNVADITDLKEREETLRRMNLLLKVVSELSRAISHEKTEFRILSDLRTHLEKVGIKSAVYLNEGGLVPVSISKDLDESVCENIAIRHLDSNEVARIEHGRGEIVVLPFSDVQKVYGLAVLFLNRVLTEEEAEILLTLGRDVAFSIKSLKIEREKEAALKVIMDNLNHFEYLADKLRNPLAIIKGYIEVRSDISSEELIAKIEEQAGRIEEILDELRAREIATYEMKKILDR